MMRVKKRNKPLNGKPSRRQLRREKRIEKKVRKNEYYTKRGKQPTVPGQFVRNRNSVENQTRSAKTVVEKSNKISPSSSVSIQTPINIEQQINVERKQQKKLQEEMTKQRNKQLKLANETEDRNIKKLEQQLKLNKRKSKGIPKSFSEDGLDFLLEVCDPNKMKSAVTAEQQFTDFNKDFMEDLALMSGEQPNSKQEKIERNFHGMNSDNSETDEQKSEEITENSSEEIEDVSNSEDIELDDSNDNLTLRKGQKRKINEYTNYDESKKIKSTNDNETQIESGPKHPKDLHNKRGVEGKLINTLEGKKWTSENNNQYDSMELEENFSSGEDIGNLCLKGANKVNPDGTWEDIYGRLRSKDGALLNNTVQKYLPPAVRATLESEEDKKVVENLSRLKKQLKGLINRLAENNMHNIATQIDELYMNNSRNNMNETLTNLIIESVVSNVMTPERLLTENVLLIAVLHANVGMEVGAHFLQNVVLKFCENLGSNSPVEDKTLDNMVKVLAQLYNFRLFDSKLMYEILHKLSENFDEKNIDCILHVLRNVGFNLRKDDPVALKNLILELQKRAATISQNFVSGTRVKFLLDILLAIKNNNMSKIPNYDNSYSEHLKKVMKGHIRKGNYVTQLNIALEDLLKAEERGKWWVVGSAWTGNISDEKKISGKPTTESFSQKLLELARKQRMNTDTRRNIFCIIMSAEDYLDAFEKLLHLGLTNNQDREIIHVIIHCCLQENPYNPYYALLAQKFCDYDRKYQQTIKYSIWDKLKALGEQSANQSSNLAKLLIHLFLEKGLPISTLKIVEFSELNKLTLRFMRQILLGILLHEDIEACTQVFEKVAQSDKLKMFKESLRLFIHHFMLRNINSEQVSGEQRALLETRAKIIDKLLTLRGRSKFSTLQ